MNDLKKQMNQIDIPKSLHKRSLQGIEQARKEQHKPKSWMPKVLTVAVTLAAVGFVALSIGRQDTQQKQNSLFVGSFHSPILYWSIAILLMLITIYIVKIAIRKRRDKKFSMAIGFVIMLLLGNSAFYLQNQLPKPITVPLVQDFYSGNESHDFTIHYITNKSDRRSVKYLQSGNFTLLAKYSGELENEDVFYYPKDVAAESAQHFLRAVYFSGNNEEIQALVNSDVVYLVLDDGEKLATTLQLDFDHLEKKQPYNFVSSSGGSDGDNSVTYVISKDTVFDTIYIPKALTKTIHFKNIEVDQNVYSEKDFPVAVKKGQRVTVSFHIEESGMDIHAMVGISGPDGILQIWMLKDASFNIQSIRKEIESRE